MGELVAGARPSGAGTPYIARRPARQSHTGGLVGSLFGCLFGLIGVFLFSVVFVPMAVLCSAIGLLRASRIWIAGVAVIGLILSAIGFVTSPTLLLLASALVLLPSHQTPATLPTAPQRTQIQIEKPAAAATPAAATSVAPPVPSQQSVSELLASPAHRIVPLASGPGLHWSQAAPKAEWFEVSQSMVGCSQAEDSPQLQQSAMQAILAWQARTALPQDCRVVQPGRRLLLDTEQTEPQRQQLVKLWEMHCRSGCVPFASPVYMPPWRIVGPYLRPSAPPPGWE